MKLVVSWPATMMLLAWPTIWFARSGAPVSLLRALTCDYGRIAGLVAHCTLGGLSAWRVAVRMPAEIQNDAPGGRPGVARGREWWQGLHFQIAQVNCVASLKLTKWSTTEPGAGTDEAYLAAMRALSGLAACVKYRS